MPNPALSPTARNRPDHPLERRLDEIRGLLREPLTPDGADLSRPEVLSDLVLTLSDRVERKHRQLIETSVQLTSLREVAHRLLSVRSADRAAETIALYLNKAWGYPRVAVLLLDREHYRLCGTLIQPAGRGFGSTHLTLPIADAEGSLVDAFLSGEVRRLEAGTAAALYSGDGDLSSLDFAGLGPMTVAPLRAGTSLPLCHAEKACGNTACPVFQSGRPTACWQAPDVDCRHEIRFGQEPRRATCLSCSVFPLLGLVLVARNAGESDLDADDLVQIDSVAATLATVVENGRLYQDLRQGELFRDDLLNSMGSGLVALDLERKAISMNRTAVRLTGWDLTESIGRTPPFLASSDRGLDAALRGAYAGKPVLRKEVHLSRKDGTSFPASISTAPLRNPEGALYGVIATFQDLTEFKSMEERIRQLDRLAALGRFTAAIAHEIRNPLAGISAGVEYLTRGNDPAGEQGENARFILTEIRRLNKIVEDLFRVTHPRPLMTNPERPEAILERSLKSLGTLPAEAGVEIVTQFDPKVPAVPVDADQIQQVAINLIKNAIEAMDGGGRLTLATGTRPGRMGETGFVTLRVSDTGPGMSPETRKRLFEPFFSRKAAGTGLGLYICHGIVERHGGYLRVESTEGAGSTFTVELPREPLSNGGAS
jgi:PAS domain S-box-containing protein